MAKPAATMANASTRRNVCCGSACASGAPTAMPIASAAARTVPRVRSMRPLARFKREAVAEIGIWIV
jgi:hypothetical protein